MISSYLKEIDFVEKSNKKYKATADKKRREEFFEKEDMKIVYLGRENLNWKILYHAGISKLELEDELFWREGLM